jgi:hypothetical protein
MRFCTYTPWFSTQGVRCFLLNLYSSPWHNAKGYGGMTFVSFAYQDEKSGLYMSLYFSPKVHTAVEKEIDLV